VIIVLLVAGLLVGPVLGLLDPDELLGDLLFPVGSLSVGVILFEGSLSLGVRQLRAAGPVALSLVTVWAAVAFATTTLLGVPVLGLLDPAVLFGELLFPVVSLSVGVILFDGSLSLGVRQLRAAGPVALSLVTVGAAVAFVLTTLLAVTVLGRPAHSAALLGAILVVTGPTVIGPLLRQVRPRGRLGPILRTEGILIDPLGAVLALLVFEVVEAEQTGQAVVSILGTLAGVGLS